jgi:hypothetical protein
MVKRFQMLFQEDDFEKIKKKAQKEKSSVSAFMRRKAFEEIDKAPNLVTGNWWDDTTIIRKIAKELKKK